MALHFVQGHAPHKAGPYLSPAAEHAFYKAREARRRFEAARQRFHARPQLLTRLPDTPEKTR